MTIVSSAYAKIFSRILRTMSSSDVPPRSQRPTPPRKRVSPERIRACEPRVNAKLVLPGVWPGVWRTVTTISPTRSSSPSRRSPSIETVRSFVGGKPTQRACSLRSSYRGRSAGWSKPLASVRSRSSARAPMWSKWACVWTSCLARRPCFSRRSTIASTSSPPSITIASPVRSSPRIVQLQASGPTGKCSTITALVSERAAVLFGRPGHAAETAFDDVADEDRVSPGAVFFGEGAVEVCQRVLEDRRAGRPGPPTQAAEAVLDGGAGESFCDLALIERQDVYAEAHRRRDQGMRLRAAIDADQEHRRIGRNAGERVRRETVYAMIRSDRRHDRDPGREASHRSFEVFRRYGHRFQSLYRPRGSSHRGSGESRRLC